MTIPAPTVGVPPLRTQRAVPAIHDLIDQCSRAEQPNTFTLTPG